MTRVLQVHPDDDLIVALADLAQGDSIDFRDTTIALRDDIPSKHKFAARSIAAGQTVKMYGIVVGVAKSDIGVGQRLTTENLQHQVSELDRSQGRAAWQAPDVSRWQDQTFDGFHRPDGRVGTRNFWIVVPMVFCQNRNVDVLRDALLDELGYRKRHAYRMMARDLVAMHQSGQSAASIRETTYDFSGKNSDEQNQQLLSSVDGIKFLTHDGGCGGLYHDAKTLCGLLAGYINHPNVAGATVLSLGCQKSQLSTLQEELDLRNPDFRRPLVILEQQQEGTEQTLMEKALRHTFAGVVEANDLQRQPAALSHLTLGVECGGSDGFSGLSANPAIGHCSDLVVALGGSVILSEFPELSGCENELVARCQTPQVADRFLDIMRAYEFRAEKDGGGFDQNPSPGNVRDGLITDAMKSAGAARKGGASPIVDVLDYPEPVTKFGLNLLCTPGGDVESTTAMAGSGANVQLFSTGLGTPTGNPISPVLKTSSNSNLAERMPDIIDIDAGGIIDGNQSIEEVGSAMLDLVIETASGRYEVRAERLGQDDFIPWRRGISI